MNETERRERVIEWLKTIEQQTRRIAIDHHIFVETKDLIAANTKVSRMGSEFFRWMQDNYIVAQAVAIRRQTDPDKRAISIKRLLLELRKFPRLASRDYFVSLHADFPKEIAEEAYDNFVGKGVDALDPAQVEDEIAELDKRTELIKNLADRKFAHADRRGTGQLPRFTDVEDCIAFFERLVKRYFLLLRATHLAALLPTFQYDWKEIFRYPWIDESMQRHAPDLGISETKD